MVVLERDNLSVEQERAVLVGVDLPERPLDTFPEPLAELYGLATTAGAKVLGNVIQRRQKPDQTTYLGKGKVRQLGELAQDRRANVIIFDNELLPAQQRNLEERTKTKVVDRTELILDIFATRAMTHQARLQVELAQLEYLRPRLKRMWTHLERLGGGIGTRGPGEQQLETDRRLIDKRIRDLKERLSVIQRRKEREVGARANEFRVSLVGYTNSGKSTLMRRLTGADTLIANKLFATLDTRTRQWTISGWGKVLLSDTVGFIRNLPHDLVASFKATLEEATHADLLIHVVDAASPVAADQIDAVNQVLEEIGARASPTILALNQIDRVEDRALLQSLERLHPHSVCISAATGEGIDQLTGLVCELLGERYVEARVETHAGNGKVLAYLAAHGQVLGQEYIDDRVQVRVKMPRHLLERIRDDQTRIEILSTHAGLVPESSPGA